MKKLIFATIIGLVVAPALAFGGLRLYADPALTQCTLSDTDPSVASVYVAYSTVYIGTIGARFRVASSPGFTGLWLADATPYVHIGSSQSDFSVAFEECKRGTFLFLTITYQLLGTSTCSNLAIAPSMGFPFSFCFDDCWDGYPCQDNKALYVNCDGCNPVAAELTTWGKVKALYRD